MGRWRACPPSFPVTQGRHVSSKNVGKEAGLSWNAKGAASPSLLPRSAPGKGRQLRQLQKYLLSGAGFILCPRSNFRARFWAAILCVLPPLGSHGRTSPDMPATWGRRPARGPLRSRHGLHRASSWGRTGLPGSKLEVDFVQQNTGTQGHHSKAGEADVQGLNYLVPRIVCVSVGIDHTLHPLLLHVSQLFKFAGLRNPPDNVADSEPGPRGPGQ